MKIPNEPLVSVVIPIYDNEQGIAYLRRNRSSWCKRSVAGVGLHAIACSCASPASGGWDGVSKQLLQRERLRGLETSLWGRANDLAKISAS